MADLKICSVCGKTGYLNEIIKGLCVKHYKQLYRHGKVLDRTKYDPNDFVIDGDLNCLKISLFSSDGRFLTYCLIDYEDYEGVRDFKWGYSNTNNACRTTINDKDISIHRFLLKPSKDLHIDHINHNRLDNRRENLRVCTHAENMMNQIPTKNHGIFERGSKFQVQFSVKGKTKYFGRFATYEEAKEVYNTNIKKYRGEFGNLIK